MRAWLCVCLAACGSNHTTRDGATVDSVSADGVLGAPLRVTVNTFEAPGGVLAGDTNWRIWGRDSLGVAPVYVVPGGCGDTLVGYTTTGPVAHVALVSGNHRDDTFVGTLDLGSFVLRGLAAEPDGMHFAALLWDQTKDPAQLHVTRFDLTGAAGWTADLSDPLAAPTDFGIGESRLDYGNGRYGAYYHVHGISGFANGHEGDQLEWIDSTSGAVTTGWSWGCSHSMSELLATSGTKTLAACVTDCYPGTTGSNFATDSIGGVYLDDATKVLDVDGGCNGSVAGELGSLAPGPIGFKMVFNAHQAPATNGQSSYSTATMNQDIGFVDIATNGTPGPVKWLTTTPGNENDASIAHLAGTSEQYVVGWNDGTSHQLARIGADGTFLEGPITTQASWGERDDPFRADPRGDVLWAWFDAPGATSFHLARVLGTGEYCGTL